MKPDILPVNSDAFDGAESEPARNGDFSQTHLAQGDGREYSGSGGDSGVVEHTFRLVSNGSRGTEEAAYEPEEKVYVPDSGESVRGTTWHSADEEERKRRGRVAMCQGEAYSHINSFKKMQSCIILLYLNVA